MCVGLLFERNRKCDTPYKAKNIGQNFWLTGNQEKKEAVQLFLQPDALRKPISLLLPYCEETEGKLFPSAFLMFLREGGGSHGCLMGPIPREPTQILPCHLGMSSRLPGWHGQEA